MPLDHGLSHVYPFVAQEVVPLGRSVGTQGAGKGFLTGVDPHVSLQVTSEGKVLVAVVAWPSWGTAS